MKTFNKKKGFTIVELVIVIAVIGVLTAVLVPTFVNLVNKANEASNQAFVKDLNTAMAMREVEEGKNKTMTEAVKDAQDIGFDVEKLTPVNGRDLVWDSVANRFLLLDPNGDVWYGKEEKRATKDIEIWQICDRMPGTQKYSIYAKPTWSADTVNGLTVGFDAGSNTAIQTVNYTNTGAAKTVTIRTNGGALTVNAPEDTIHHYGEASVVNLQAVGSHSFYERGSVNLIDIKKGRLIITNDEDAEIGTIYLSATDDAYDGIILATQNGSELPGIVAREGVSAPASGEKLVVTIQTGVNEQGEQPAEEESIYLYPESDVKEGDAGYDVSDLGLLVVEAVSSDGQAQAAEQLADKGEEVLEGVMESKVEDSGVLSVGATLFKGGLGTEKNPFIIAAPEHLMNIGKGLETGATAYYRLINDIELTDDLITFDGAYGYYNIVEDVKQDIHLDLGKNAITNINASIFDVVYHIEVSNGRLAFNADTKNATLVEVVRHADEGATASFHDLSIEGTALVSEAHWGPLVCYMYGCNTNASTISADKILVNLMVKNSRNDSYSGGVFGYIQGSKIAASITNCQVNGSIQGPYAYGFFNGCSYPEGAVVVNSGNVLYGSLLGSKGVGAFGLNGNYNPSGDSPEKQDALVENHGQLAMVTASETLIHNQSSMVIGDQIIVDNDNSNVSYAIVSIVYWTNRASDGTGGYPNNIDMRVEINGQTGSFESGLYMNKIVQATARHTGECLIDGPTRQVWKEGSNYMVYQEDAVFSAAKGQIHVYAYNESGTMVTFQSMEYAVK